MLSCQTKLVLISLPKRPWDMLVTDLDLDPEAIIDKSSVLHWFYPGCLFSSQMSRMTSLILLGRMWGKEGGKGDFLLLGTEEDSEDTSRTSGAHSARLSILPKDHQRSSYPRITTTCSPQARNHRPSLKAGTVTCWMFTFAHRWKLTLPLCKPLWALLNWKLSWDIKFSTHYSV